MLNLNSFEILKANKYGNYLVSIAIGDKYLERFKSNVLETWKLYADKNNLGIIVFIDHLIDESDQKWKKPNWQKLLISSVLIKAKIEINLICYLDTDIVVNPFAPNIFSKHVPRKISVVSLRNNLPFNYSETLKRLVLLRKKFIDSNYPLDSGIFASLETLYNYQNLPTQKDEFCAGLLMFKPSEFATLLEKWFYMYDQNVKSITNGGEQTHLNYHILSEGLENFLDYKFQAIWSYEIANYYPFLFFHKFSDRLLLEYCVQATLMRVHFLHFAGSWPENSRFFAEKFFLNTNYLDLYKEFRDFQKTTMKGQPKGQINPSNI
jgi:hypothetical protein